ncbi:MAG: glycolate oxidase subunit GlcE [Gammaproteobacteria bacterium]|nr:glycolate oxidase subunit GlcE [Gammaproteobacteria bacterium]
MNVITTNVDCSKELAEQVRRAFSEDIPLCIDGGGSKVFEGRPVEGKSLSVLGHHGIIDHAPSELVITARAGTPLADIESRLAGASQMLAFEPPHLDAFINGNATIGGTVSCGISGPRRPYAGAARDVVLGARIINGRGEILSFGGQVMKNVAGYDVSRLMVGAQGTLGILLDVSLKVLPMPECEKTLCLEMSEEDAIQAMNHWAGQPVPISAACHLPSDDGESGSKRGRLYLRLSGVESALKAAAEKIGGDDVSQGQQFWLDLRERKLEFFNQPDSLWRLSLPPASPALSLPGSCLMDWGGAQRWLKTHASVEDVQSAATKLGGHATLYHPQGAQFAPLSSGLRALHQRLKETFDPKNILNPGRLYEGL